MIDPKVAELARDWRAKAQSLDEYAARCRMEGDTYEATEAEDAARDNWIAADELEMAGSVELYAALRQAS